ncbi:GTP-binding protein At3g49725, chloroplastic isoform X3 [Cynara cardunculus var. scolymus]|uniref:GTP-binding protein At3g49725, chloroplastic isoform X3 n=1 Tax=Cynara cardunculus var. scolymus TaxID=59895 RepID=UPI000D623041|nr:GTP-binding protein At3g49725, chloroplastic isoform X3 [Cynara cardunculus var. scolymus]XP_024975631.1 GTP-binding protein At3g49725, chloroplastic isoform X3 [Cynara cardunculus var. scolymus]
MFRAAYQIRASFRYVAQTLSGKTNLSSTSVIPSLFTNLQARHKHEEADADEFNKDPGGPPRLFVVQPRFRPDAILKIKLDEALNLANSLEEQRDGYYDTDFAKKELPPHLVVQNPAYRITRADTFFGPGTVDNIKCHLNAEDSKGGVDAIFVNGTLTGIQQRNLERAWGKAVLDRVGLIIEIFHAHAQTKEAKLQAELAALMYKRSRLVRVRGSDGRFTFGAPGEAEVVSARGRGSGGRGFISGAGETELQLQRRRIIERRNHLLSEIKEVRRTRALQRASRKRRGGSHGQDMPTVAIVGYTNAGKSTLVSALSDTYLFSDNRMFATVDTKVRNVILPSGKKVLLSDTVGFISDLPVQLVDAFHATLEEVAEADLLVHVLDSSAPNRDEQKESVLQVLQQIGVSNEKLQNMIEVWNKIDLEHDETAINEQIEEDVDDNLDDWLSPGDGEVKWDDATSSFVGWKVSEPDRTKPNELRVSHLEVGSMDQPKDINEPSVSHLEVRSRDHPKDVWNCKSDPKYEPDVKTSAITRVGLQELLDLIDDKLKTEEVLERNVFERKWRPPRDHDTGVVVG